MSTEKYPLGVREEGVSLGFSRETNQQEMQTDVLLYILNTYIEMSRQHY